MRIRIGLVGDRDDAILAHRAIPLALSLVAASLDVDIDAQWVPTESIEDNDAVEAFDGLWCVPGSPYRSMEGALLAIRYAREQQRPFLGTCGGFQHAMLEYARNVLGWADAEHAETAPDAARPVIVPLLCSLVEVREPVHLQEGSRIASIYGVPDIIEGYHCNYGLGDAFRDEIASGPLHVSATDDAGGVRAVELVGHPFYLATLFQPERAALDGMCPPLVRAFAAAAVEARRPRECEV
ncbi:MAG TPA: CTP synthase [Luteibacter sp.]|nr:CTP synthase [Luteibacter sp.]